MQKPNKFLPHHSLVTFNRSFIQPHLDHADNKIKTYHSNAAQTIDGCIRGSKEKKLYHFLLQLFLFDCVLRVACNFLQFFFFFSFSFSSLFLERLQKYFLLTFHHSLPKKRVTKIGIISLDTLKKTCVKILPLVVIRDACGT